MTDVSGAGPRDEENNLDAVEQQIREIRNRKRGRIRWSISKHTAEMAIDALQTRDKPPRRLAKTRRRKRTKRLL